MSYDPADLVQTHSAQAGRSFAAPDGTPLSILVIEDEKAVGTVLELVLNIAGHRVELADSVTAARSALERSDFDLVLLDLHLPDGHGFDLLKHLRGTLDRPTPVIVLSSARAEENRPQSIELGANDYLTKPFSSEEVIARVRQWTAA